MLSVRMLFVASFFVFTCLLLPGTALASTKCQCNNGTTAISMSDDADACDDACDMLGGGHVWQSDDAEEGDDSDVGEVDSDGVERREQRRESVVR